MPEKTLSTLDTDTDGLHSTFGIARNILDARSKDNLASQRWTTAASAVVAARSRKAWNCPPRPAQVMETSAVRISRQGVSDPRPHTKCQLACDRDLAVAFEVELKHFRVSMRHYRMLNGSREVGSEQIHGTQQPRYCLTKMVTLDKSDRK